MNDLDLRIDNLEELKAILQQIATEYPENHRIRKMTEKIVARYKNYTANLSFNAKLGAYADLNNPELYQITWPLSHEAECLNQVYGSTHYQLMKFYKMVKTPAVIKSLIEVLLKAGRESAYEVFAIKKKAHAKSEVERDPMTGKVRKKQPVSKNVRYGTLVNIKAQEMPNEL